MAIDVNGGLWNRVGQRRRVHIGGAGDGNPNSTFSDNLGTCRKDFSTFPSFFQNGQLFCF